MRKIISTIGIVATLLPSSGFAMIPDEDTLASILGTRNPPSVVTVGTVQSPMFNSVHYWDNISNVTPRVLNRSIRADIVRVHTNALNGEHFTNAAKKNKAAMESHCRSRLNADGVKNAVKECNLSM